MMSVEYREFLAAVSKTVGLESGAAKVATEATLGVLACVLDEAGRDHLNEALPSELRIDVPVNGESRDWDEPTFVRAVSIVSRHPVEQARLQAQAVLSALAGQDPALVAELRVPDRLHGLFVPPAPGGGVSGPAGHDAPLTDEELGDALSRLPYWSGDTRALRRTIALPQENLDRVLARLDGLRGELGRAPGVHRDAETAELVVQTAAVGAVTARDVELARRVDEIIDEAGAGIGSPYGSP